MQELVTGVQQVGIGVADAGEAMHLYKRLFGMDVLVFDDVAEAALMTRYTGDKKHTRRAILTLNMAGGGGFEIWQFQNRQPLQPLQPVEYGDLGINAVRIKCIDVDTAYKFFSACESVTIYPVQKGQDRQPFFYLKDAYGNYFQLVEGLEWFAAGIHITGGVSGSVIGVTDIDKALLFYKDVLGINETVYDITGSSRDFSGNIYNYRKLLLRKHPGGKGAFNKLLGTVDIELIQCLDRKPKKIYENRYWGDLGFIHLCLDVLDMDSLKDRASQHGFSFTVDSKESFAMEAAAGRFCYAEDPDGTLIELVETHKVPIMKKYGLYLNLQKRGLLKPLPDWMIRLLSLSKVK